MHADWYQHNSNVVYLKIANANITKIERNAFATTPFQNLFELRLVNMSIGFLANDTVNSTFLRTLYMENVLLETIENGFFTRFPKLQTLDIIESLTPTSNVNNFFTHATRLPLLQYMQYKDNNLANVVRKETFGNLTSLRNLSLQQNKITSINVDAFEIVAKNLKYLNLTMNFLKTLPDGIFRPFVGNTTLFIKKILLENNLWHCSCGLHWLQVFMMQTDSVIIDHPECITPYHLKYKVIVFCRICAYNSSGTNITLEPFDETTTSEILTNHTNYDNVELPTQPLVITPKPKVPDCPIDTIPFGSESFSTNQILNVVEKSEGGSVLLHLLIVAESHILIWYQNNILRKIYNQDFSKYLSENTTQPQSQMQTIAYTVKLLPENETYIFCIAKKISFDISPLDCVSYRRSPITIVQLDYNEWHLLVAYASIVLGGLVFLYMQMRKQKLIGYMDSNSKQF